MRRPLLLIASLLALAGCDADLTAIEASSCSDYADKANKCKPGTASSAIWTTSCTLNGFSGDCRNCIAKTDCTAIPTTCNTACKTSDPFVVITSSSSGGTTGHTTGGGSSGTTATTGSSKGCSEFSVDTYCDSIRATSCGDSANLCPNGRYCPSSSTCQTGGGCSCNSGYKSIHCDTGAFCAGDCAGGEWWCHPTTEPGCTGSLSYVGGTCFCRDSYSIPVTCSGSTSSTCQQLCTAAGH